MDKAIIPPSLGSKERPLRVAIVGTGPAGFYAAETLLKDSSMMIEVDMFDRLPTPYGLVRHGVAPDHQNIKAVTKKLERIAAMPKFQFFGNVEFGKHFFLEDLQNYYDQVLFAVGCPSDRQLKIPGETFEGSYSASTLISWYNSHPDFSHVKFDFSSIKKIAIIGMGNVAIDIARILMENPQKLAHSDIADHALSSLENSSIEEIYLIGRRSAAHAAFTLKEIEELVKLETSEVTFQTNEIESDNLTTKSELNDETIKKIEYMRNHNKHSSEKIKKRISIRFLLSPIEILAENGKINAIKLEKNNLVEDHNGDLHVKGTNQFEILPVDMVIRSIGFQGKPIPNIPFDNIRGVILNQDGRVTRPTGEIVKGVYVTGWAKRGATGVIGTNRNDSTTVAQLMIADAKNQEISNERKKFHSAHQLIKMKHPNYTSFNDWLKLDKIELDRGSKKGKIRDKFTTIAAMNDYLINNKSNANDL